jgi:hypothetical protein
MWPQQPLVPVTSGPPPQWLDPHAHPNPAGYMYSQANYPQYTERGEVEGGNESYEEESEEEEEEEEEEEDMDDPQQQHFVDYQQSQAPPHHHYHHHEQHHHQYQHQPFYSSKFMQQQQHQQLPQFQQQRSPPSQQQQQVVQYNGERGPDVMLSPRSEPPPQPHPPIPTPQGEYGHPGDFRGSANGQEYPGEYKVTYHPQQSAPGYSNDGGGERKTPALSSGAVQARPTTPGGEGDQIQKDFLNAGKSRHSVILQHGTSSPASINLWPLYTIPLRAGWVVMKGL